MKNNKLTVSMDMLLVSFAFMIFVCSFLEIRNIIHLDTKMLQNIFMKNLEPIEDIKLGRNYCEEDKGYYPLVNYTFAGVKEYCYIQGTKKIVNKSCSSSNDISIGPIEPKTLNIWHDKNICIKRMQNTSLTFEIIPSDQKCKEGYNECGYINSHKKKMCLKPSDTQANPERNCPVNFLEITEEDPSKYSEGYTILPLTNNINLIYSKIRDNSSIPIDFKVSEGRYPCLEVERRSFINDPFPLLTNFPVFNCNRNNYIPQSSNDTGYDRRYSEIDVWKKQNFFEDNDLYHDYKELFYPGWTNDINSTNFTLFYRDYYHDKENCENYEKFEDALLFQRTRLYIKLVVSLANILIMVILISFLSLVKVFSNFVHSLVFLVKIILCYVFMIYNLLIIKLSVEKDLEVIKDFLSHKTSCFDEETIYTMRRYEVEKRADSIGAVASIEFWFNICYGLFVSGETCRFIHKVYVRIKNKYRREIAVREIGEEKLQDILKDYREKEKREKERLKKRALTKRKVSH